jgi:hypothetical protein
VPAGGMKMPSKDTKLFCEPSYGKSSKARSAPIINWWDEVPRLLHNKITEALINGAKEQWVPRFRALLRVGLVGSLVSFLAYRQSDVILRWSDHGRALVTKIAKSCRI